MEWLKDTSYVGKELSYSYEIGTKLLRMVVPLLLHLLLRLYFLIVVHHHKSQNIDSTHQMNPIRNQLDLKFNIQISLPDD